MRVNKSFVMIILVLGAVAAFSQNIPDPPGFSTTKLTRKKKQALPKKNTLPAPLDKKAQMTSTAKNKKTVVLESAKKELGSSETDANAATVQSEGGDTKSSSDNSTEAKSNSNEGAKAQSSSPSIEDATNPDEILADLGDEKPVLPKGAPKCLASYLPMIKDRELSIIVAFGYKDARPFRFVADRYEKMYFIERIIAACEDSNNACGFERSKEDPEIFTRKVTGIDAKPLTIKIRMVTGSAGPDDEENRISPYQKWVSLRAEKVFTEGLQSADVVLYSGHSRAGGGPDFRSPALYKNNHVAYDLYKKKQPGLKLILNTLEKKPDSSIKLLGLFSCASSQLFVKAIQETKPGIGVISSTALLYHADAFENMMMALDSLVVGRCRPEFSDKLRSENARQGSKVFGFF